MYYFIAQIPKVTLAAYNLVFATSSNHIVRYIAHTIKLLHFPLTMDCFKVFYCYITVSALHARHVSSSVLLTAGGAVVLLTNR